MQSTRPKLNKNHPLLLDANVSDAVSITLCQKCGMDLSAVGEEEWYLSSTEEDEFNAWSVDMYNGDTYSLNKNRDGYVRAVATF